MMLARLTLISHLFVTAPRHRWAAQALCAVVRDLLADLLRDAKV
jgi:hypothetical protein